MKINQSSIIKSELSLTGLHCFFNSMQYEDILQDLESSLTHGIQSHALDVTPAIFTYAKSLVDCSLSEFSPTAKEALLSLFLSKLQRYLLSPFTQDTASSGSSFKYTVNNFYPSTQSKKFISQSLELLLSKYNTSAGELIFNDLTINCASDNILCQELSVSIAGSLGALYNKDFKISVGGQIKLHPPKLHDAGSISWHYDGDPFYIKVLLYLADQPDGPDGSFEMLLPLNSSTSLESSHVKTAIQSIFHGEIMSIIKSGYQRIGPFMLSSHLPRVYSDKMAACNHEKISITPIKYRYTVFKGCEVLHRGGSNTKSFRPVFQGLLSAHLG